MLSNRIWLPLLSLLMLAGCSLTDWLPDEVAPEAVSPIDNQVEATTRQSDLPLEQIVLPEGFSISLYAAGVEGARSMVLSEEGTLYVGTRSQGKVYALRDEDQDGVADAKYTLASGLNSPNGVALKDGDLYVAEVNRILRYDEIEAHLEDPPEPTVVFDDLPSDSSHGWKYIAFGPDGELYIPIGAPCNICNAGDPYASLNRLNVETGELTTVARGIRNTVGFAWDPASGELWFTDNGRDRLGDDLPPDELNHITEEGQHFGYPYCHGGDIQDPEFNNLPCANFQPPARNLGPHVAALGLLFYEGEQFPVEYQNDILIAEHGSWNRSEKIGYRVMRVQRQANSEPSYEPFATGWLQGETAWGRPVDVLQQPDGSILVSDDAAHAIYHIRYQATE